MSLGQVPAHIQEQQKITNIEGAWEKDDNYLIICQANSKVVGKELANAGDFYHGSGVSLGRLFYGIVLYATECYEYVPDDDEKAEGAKHYIARPSQMTEDEREEFTTKRRVKGSDGVERDMSKAKRTFFFLIKQTDENGEPADLPPFRFKAKGYGFGAGASFAGRLNGFKDRNVFDFVCRFETAKAEKHDAKDDYVWVLGEESREISYVSDASVHQSAAESYALIAQSPDGLTYKPQHAITHES